MASLGCTDRVGMVDLWFNAGMAQRAFSPAGPALFSQTLDRRCMHDLRIHAGSVIYVARPSCSSMVVQSPAVFGARIILCLHCCSGYFSAWCTNQFNRYRTPGRLDFGRGTVFCQLGLCHVLRWVRFASDVLIEIYFIKAIFRKFLVYD